MKFIKSLIDKVPFFYMLSLMSLSLAALTKKAIESSLKQNWSQAADLNLEILKIYPNNTDTKIRLGRCYLQMKDFNKAKKIFREVLKADPINPLALKNLEMAKNEKVESNGNGDLKTKSLLKEPGTTCETKIQIREKSLKQEDFTSGEELPIKARNKSIDVLKIKKGKRFIAGVIEDSYIVQRINCAIEKEKRVSVNYVKMKDREMFLLIKSSAPIFKPDKVEIRPYLKKGTLEEPEIEIDSEIEETE